MKFLTIFLYLAIYSEPLCATYASFGGGGSHIINEFKKRRKRVAYGSGPIRGLSGWGYYHISNAMHDTNTVEEQATYVMCDSNTFSLICGTPFSYCSSNFINIINIINKM